MRPAWRAVVGLAAFVALPPALHAGQAEFIYVTANVGGSSGGHAAIRFDDVVYHFQQHDAGLLRLARTGAEHFRWTYGVLENRTMRVARLRTSPETYELLRDRFNERFLAEEKQFAVAQALADDGALLERWLATTTGDRPPPTLPNAVPLPAAGLFDSEADEAPALGALRRDVARVHGSGYLEDRAAALAQAIRDLRPSPAPGPVVGPDAFPTPTAGLAERYGDLALELVAVETLARARPLRPDARAVIDGDDGRPTTAERLALIALREKVAASLVGLLDSERLDRGRALLVGMARLEAVDATLSTGRWTLVDAFPDAPATIRGADDAGRRAFLGDLHDDATNAFATARRALADAAEPDERRYAALEDAGNRLVELARGLADGGPVRVRAAALVPSRSAQGVELPVPALTRAELVAAADDVRRAARAHRHALAEAYRYDLRRRNCVSEIFATVAEALGREGSVARLGGYVDPYGGLDFWPWVAFHTVLATWNVASVEEIPSYRHARIARMYEQEPAALAYLREANTLTSTVYRWSGDDAPFLFFTDDAVALRPLYGAANVATGVGVLALGAVRSPFDGGRSLWSGAKSLAFSLPELVFVNIRKGTMAYGRAAVGTLTGERDARGETTGR